MNKIKASIYIVATMMAISCQPAIALNLKESPTPTTKSTILSHQEVLTHLMLAELALQRDMPKVALENYLLVAKSTHDPEVAQLATELAIQLQASTEALAATEIWANAATDNLQAQLVAVSLFVNSDPNKTVNFLNNAFNIENTDIDQHLSLIMNKLSNAGQKNLTSATFKVAEQRKQDPYAQLAAAQIAAVQLDIANAKQKLKLALNLKPDLTSAIELNAKIIRHDHNDDKPALDYLEAQVNKYPKNSELRMFYVTALTDNNQIAKAIPQLEVLSKDPIQGGEALISLGEIYITKQNYNLAETTIKKALKFANVTNKANYYLAQLAEYKNHIKEAIGYYESVTEDSEYHIPAFLRAAYLYSTAGDYPKALATLQSSSPNTFFDQKQVLLTQIDVLIDSQDFEQALDNCNTAIAIIPDDVDFLYARSVVFGLMNNGTEAEKDLRTILSADPNNANALNALGFTLANQPSRMNEALPLLQKAINLNPDNPAFMDSMGWLLFRMGKTQESLDMLGKAYKLSGDNEIAAHYGEVLWSSGKKDAAKDIWNKALMSSPLNQEAIHDTLIRLKIPLSDLSSTAINKSTKIKEAR